MAQKTTSPGLPHKLPKDMKQALAANKIALQKWEEDVTRLGRNEWICFVISVKKAETRQEHIKRMISELKEGKQRPCCFMGCTHRTDKPMNASQKWILNKQLKRK